MLDNIKIIFFHIEKSMGSSIRIILENYFKNIFNINEIYIPSKFNNINLITSSNYKFIDNLPNDFKVLLCHIPYKNNLTNILCNNIFSITCIRNPYNRIISHYYFFDYPKYKKYLYELSNDEIINILNNYGNLTFKRLGSINKITEINCILIMEKIKDDIINLNEILNVKYNKNINLKLQNVNSNNKYSLTIQFDIIFLEKYKNYFKEDIDIYNFVNSLPLNKRFKL
jgi:hypothetical protein